MFEIPDPLFSGCSRKPTPISGNYSSIIYIVKTACDSFKAEIDLGRVCHTSSK